METVRLARRMMATEWEIVLHGNRRNYLEIVAAEALDEIGRIETLLSFYRSDSETRRVNVYAAQEPVSVDGRFLTLVEQARELNRLSEGAFDITVGPLIRAWGFAGASGVMPSLESITEARARVGMAHVETNRELGTVRFDRDGVMLEFGAIGKGYAVDQAVDILREYEIESALLHGGTSTVYGLGAPPGEDAWTVAIQRPPDITPELEMEGTTEEALSPVTLSEEEVDGDPEFLTTVQLRDAALSVSAPHGKAFVFNGKRYGHVLDPRTGEPAERSRLAALVLPSATESDALSTALLTLGAEWLPDLLQIRPDARALVAYDDATGNLKTVGNLLTVTSVP